ncbi:hypothetical protein Anas_11254 [Armadillidium nasatum]|uniref:CRAL-TRIO domain-containing protein n=1 Tax=Armadillidium nasatum TaxID=96803 RepID=A0A5N5T8Y4_9CRUS|nr:hypothetical protein Anas_11254 [Armadillidium nasatum]
MGSKKSEIHISSVVNVQNVYKIFFCKYLTLIFITKNDIFVRLLFLISALSLLLLFLISALNLLLKGTKIYESNYPEVMKYTFVINAPKTHTVIYNIAKPFLHPNTIKRIKIYGKKGWKEDLLKEIDVDQLPVHWGGTMTDPDGDTKCASNICVGGKVPKEYYLKNKVLKHQNETLFLDFKDKIILARNERKFFEFEVGDNNSGTELRWEFRSTGSDIGYEISRIISEEEESLIPFQRINSQIFKEEGALCCDKKGLCKSNLKFIKENYFIHKLKKAITDESYKPQTKNVKKCLALSFHKNY